MNKWIYHFDSNISKIDHTNLKKLLGSKGSNLVIMSSLGFPVPQGFTISTELCKYYYQHKKLPDDFFAQLENAMQKLENQTGKKFGDTKNPLLIAVRSGSQESMPGMMDTILNLGINDTVIEGIIAKSKKPIFAYDLYRRFIYMYASTVLGVPKILFETANEKIKSEFNIPENHSFTEASLKQLITSYKEIVYQKLGQEFCDNPELQLIKAIEAILKSWMSPRAITYRKINKISSDLGTAVNIQEMVFGNTGNNSATGVVFSRNPSTGEKEIFGEFLNNAQGEEIVSGVRTPLAITDQNDQNSMQNTMSEMYKQISEVCNKLEKFYRDMQDIEFTIEDGNLYILQTRNAKRTVQAAVKVAVDMHLENIISKEEAIMRIKPESLSQLLHSNIDYQFSPIEIATGLPASPGASSGYIAFSTQEAEEIHRQQQHVILVRNDTSPEDIQGMNIAKGILTARGGMTSHAAVITRGMGKPCVCGATEIIVDEKNKLLVIGNYKLTSQDKITIDGNNGKIFLGNIPLEQPAVSKECEILLQWADQMGGMQVRANAENVNDLTAALNFGANGIGLCRTEHMFFEKDKINLMQEMILSTTTEKRNLALNKLLPLHKQDFKNLFKLLQMRPVNIRLLDPPLHEFLPKTPDEQQTLANNLNISIELLQSRLEAIREVNPMLGHRGCRLGITYPEIYKMQLQAIFSAANDIIKEDNITPNLEIMIPLVSDVKELETLYPYIADYKRQFNFLFGTMIELPRSVLVADKLARMVDFFSFGTNDLTQTTYGISRDDIGSFFPYYLGHEIFTNDPFSVIDREGVGELIKLAIRKSKKPNPQIKLGVCGEHAGNPISIKYFNDIGIHYISCSPFRVPTARLATAQSKLQQNIDQQQ